MLNTYQGLVLNGLVSGFSIMMMRNYFETVPYSLAESARMDGAGELKIFGSIYMPISLPGFATVFFMEYVARWNSIMLPATLITDEKKYTLPLMLKQMIMSVDSTSGTAAGSWCLASGRQARLPDTHYGGHRDIHLAAADHLSICPGVSSGGNQYGSR